MSFFRSRKVAPVTSDFLLECKDLVRHYGQIKPVDGVSLNLRPHELLSILGPSGCGKSTLLNLIAGLDEPQAGEIFIGGEEMSNVHRIVAPELRRVGMVFQDIALFPHLNVFKNVAYGLNGSKDEKRSRVEEMLKLVELSGSEKKMPHELSGGEQQRIAIARALAPAPRLLLLDEPFNSLDYRLRVQIRQDIRDILREAKVSAILVTHDQTEAYTFADRMILLSQGKVVQNGSPEEVYHEPATAWVASFVGEANLVPLELVGSAIGLENIYQLPNIRDRLWMSRLEDIKIKRVPETTFHAGWIQEISFRGDHKILHVCHENGLVLRVSVPSRESWLLGDTVQLKPQHSRTYPA
ncbi:MAG: ABC transporter ATP-binding protein [bacterium]